MVYRLLELMCRKNVEEYETIVREALKSCKQSIVNCFGGGSEGQNADRHTGGEIMTLSRIG